MKKYFFLVCTALMLLFISVCGCTFLQSIHYSGQWEQVTSNAEWEARYEHKGVVLPDDSIVIIGGRVSSVSNNDVWRSTNKGKSWQLMTDNAEWSKRSQFATVSLPDGSIILMGGQNSGETKAGRAVVIDFRQRGPLNDVWRSTDNGASWHLMTNNAEWSPRMKHLAVALPDGSILLMGGTESDLFNDYTNDIWRSTDQGRSWDNIGFLPYRLDIGRNSVAALPNGDVIITYRSKVWCSTNGGVSYTVKNDFAGWDATQPHSTVGLPDGSVLVVSVRDQATESPRYEMWHSKDKGSTWDKIILQKYWKPTGGYDLVSLSDGSLVIMGGTTSSSTGGSWATYTPLNEVWLLNPDK